MNKRLTVIAATVLALVWAQAPAPQQATPPPQGEPDLVLHVSVNLVQVDAIVTDRNGRHVPDLKAEDFEIFQDGRPQKITHCSYISLQPSAAPHDGPGGWMIWVFRGRPWLRCGRR